MFALKHVWIITAVVAIYGIVNGFLINATPQICLALELNSGQLGMIGAGIPIGYAVSCLTFGRLFSGIPSKYVMFGGATTSLLALMLMSSANSAGICILAQVTYGLGSGAFWPFASAWLLDFQTEEITRTRLLRFYNVSWTAGTASGMFFSGLLCGAGYIWLPVRLASH